MISVNPVELVIDPLVAVTVTLDVPVGVPGSGVGAFLLPPPPQAGKIRIVVASTISADHRTEFRLPPANVREKTRPKPATHNAGNRVRCCKWEDAVAAVVAIVIVAGLVVAVPLAEMDEGVIAQVASAGSPAHARAIVPLKPLELVTFTELVPDPPGVAITTVDCAVGIDAKNPAVIVNV